MPPSLASVRQAIAGLAPYVPGLSIEEIRQKYGLANVIKMASNENPLGASPVVQELIRRHAGDVFRYPRGGNPRLVKNLAYHHQVRPEQIVVGNGSDEVIDMLMRMTCEPGIHNIVCFEPCFGIYPVQARINGIEARRWPLNPDFSFDFDALLDLVDKDTRLLFITTPDNPSGYCPPVGELQLVAKKVAESSPECLVLIDEAYMDFADDEARHSLLAHRPLPDNVAIMRTFSKSYGLAGLRIGYAILPEALAEAFWRARLPFSVNILAEEAALAALGDKHFHTATVEHVRQNREPLKLALEKLGCRVWPSQANFLLFLPPAGTDAGECDQFLLEQGIIIRRLNSYKLPHHLRVTIGNKDENAAFIKAMVLLSAKAKAKS